MSETTPLALLCEILGIQQNKDDLSQLGEDLQDLTGASKPYSYNYLHSVARGSIQPGRDLERAILALLAHHEDDAPLMIAMKEIPVRSNNETQAHAMMPPWDANLCAKCGAKFVGVSWRKYCYLCSPSRAKG